jgi:hypothetical protein
VPVPIRAPDLADPLLDAKMTDEAAAQAEAKGGGGLTAWSSSTAPHHDENAANRRARRTPAGTARIRTQ